MPKFRKAYDSHVRVTFDPVGDPVTEQHHARDCDMNHILRKYQKTGLVDHVSRYQGKYDDITEAVDYHTAMNTVINAENAFMSLPSSIRNKFKNDPGAFLDFVSNPDNHDEMVELGLLKASETVAAPAATVEPQPAPAAAEGGNDA